MTTIIQQPSSSLQHPLVQRKMKITSPHYFVLLLLLLAAIIKSSGATTTTTTTTTTTATTIIRRSCTSQKEYECSSQYHRYCHSMTLIEEESEDDDEDRGASTTNTNSNSNSNSNSRLWYQFHLSYSSSHDGPHNNRVYTPHVSYSSSEDNSDSGGISVVLEDSENTDYYEGTIHYYLDDSEVTNNDNETSETSGSLPPVISQEEEDSSSEGGNEPSHFLEEEFCSYCLDGFIEWKTNNNEDDNDSNTNNNMMMICRNISTITWDDYLDTYQPYYYYSYRRQSITNQNQKEENGNNNNNTRRRKRKLDNDDDDQRRYRYDLLFNSIQYIQDYYKSISDELIFTTTTTTTTDVVAVSSDTARTTVTVDDVEENNNNNSSDGNPQTQQKSSSSSSSSSLSQPPPLDGQEERQKKFYYNLGLTPYSADDRIDQEQRSGYFYVNFTTTTNFAAPGTSSEEGGPGKTILPKVATPTIAKADLPIKLDLSSSSEEEDGSKNSRRNIINQGRCACSWATSLVQSIEYSSTTNIPSLLLSIQQLIDCSQRNLGCDGGNLIVGMQYIQHNLFGGLTYEKDYPFVENYFDFDGIGTGTGIGSASASASASGDNGNHNNYKSDDDNTCQLTTTEKTTNLPPLAVSVPNPQIAFDYYDQDGYSQQQQQQHKYNRRIEQIKQILVYHNQPIAVVMKSSCHIMSNYQSGILTDDGYGEEDCFCQLPTCADHSVLLVGYSDDDDTDTSIPYFKFQNSWGSDWGEDGYFRVAQYPQQQQQQQQHRPYGLFGLLGHGVIPGIVHTNNGNTMIGNDNQQHEQDISFNVRQRQQNGGGDDDGSIKMQGWAIFLIVCACIVVGWCFCECCIYVRSSFDNDLINQNLY